MERALILCSGPILEWENDLANVSVSEPEIGRVAPDALFKTLQEVERGHIVAVLQESHGVIEGPSGAAKTLGLHPNTLRHRMEKLGIKRTAHQSFASKV